MLSSALTTKCPIWSQLEPIERSENDAMREPLRASFSFASCLKSKIYFALNANNLFTVSVEELRCLSMNQGTTTEQQKKICKQKVERKSQIRLAYHLERKRTNIPTTLEEKNWQYFWCHDKKKYLDCSLIFGNWTYWHLNYIYDANTEDVCGSPSLGRNILTSQILREHLVSNVFVLWSGCM